MRITDVAISYVATPLPKLLTTAIHRIDRVDNILVEITAEGLVGSGYAFAFAPHQARAIQSLVHDLTEGLVGEDATRVGILWERAMLRSNFIGRSGPAAMAIAAIDTALWDLVAQRAGLPLAKLFGAVREEVQLYATGGWTSYTVEELIEEAEALHAKGFTFYKIKIGLPDWRDDVARTEQLMSRMEGRMAVLVDANQAWRPAEAIAAGRAFQDLGVTWLEEPVDAADYRGSAEVARALDVPIATGETVFGLEGFQPLIDQRAADVLMPDLMRCAGPTGFRRVATVGSAAGFDISSHLFTETSAHLIAATPTGTFAEYLPGWWDGLLEVSHTVSGGRLRIADEPGIGFRFSEAAKRDYRVD